MNVSPLSYGEKAVCPPNKRQSHGFCMNVDVCSVIRAAYAVAIF